MTTPLKINKFASLYEKIPKYPEVWTNEDIITWLGIIGMDKYAQNFLDMGVDGYLILDLEEQDIVEELQISVKLHRKKIMKAIEVLREYTTYLKE